jgi:protein-disulfide isomerase/uncharacterized membrane protein
MLSKRHLLLIVFGMLGFMVMFWSAADWYELMRGDRMQASFCSLNSYWNCDRASMSRVGAIGLVPLGVFGMWWFWTVVILAFGSGFFRKLLKPLVASGVIVALGLGSYLIFVLSTGCLICYATYIFIFVVGFLTFGLKENPRFHLSKRATLGSLIIGVLVLGIFAFTQSYRMNNRVDEAEFQKWFQTLNIDAVPEISPLKKGSDNAKIVFMEFSDFGCPFCEKVATILNPFIAGQEDVRVVYYPFPLDSTCNPTVPRQIHPNSCDWAKGALCANEQGKLWSYHDHIFQIARETERLPPLKEEIDSFGLDRESFDACMAKQETADKLRQIIEVGANLNISSTPTLYIAGRRIQGFIPVPLLRRLLLEIRRTSN